MSERPGRGLAGGRNVTRREPRPLVVRVAIAIVLAQVIAGMMLGWLWARQAVDAERLRAAEKLAVAAKSLEAQYAGAVQTGDQESLAAATVRDARALSLRVRITDRDGLILADSANANQPADAVQPWPQVHRVLDGEQAFTTLLRTDAMLMGRAMIGVAPIRSSDGRIAGAFVLSESLDSATGQWRAVITAAAMTLLLVLATLIILHVASDALKRYAARLAAAARRYAGGELAHSLSKRGPAELGPIVDAMNEMAERIGQRIDELQSRRTEQQAIHQSMSNGLIALDLNQRILSLNRAAEYLLDMRESTVRGRLLQECLREPELNEFIAESIAGRVQRNVELRLRKPGGKPIVVEATSESLRNAAGQPVGMLVLINDVTELRRLESIRSDFAANVSHELRTPITNIKGYVETMLDVGVEDREQTARFLGIIKRNTDRLASIIEDLLSLARLEQPEAKAGLEAAPIGVGKVVAAATQQFESAARLKGISVLVEAPEDLQVLGNGQLLEQAVANLLSNAIKYSPPDTQVRIYARPITESELEVAVVDEGPGIAVEHLPRIFERFYRVDKARSREVGGTGLGLSIVKHIALVHGGRVEVVSELGRGSTFKLILPRA